MSREPEEKAFPCCFTRLNSYRVKIQVGSFLQKRFDHNILAVFSFPDLRQLFLDVYHAALVYFLFPVSIIHNVKEWTWRSLNECIEWREPEDSVPCRK